MKSDNRFRRSSFPRWLIVGVVLLVGLPAGYYVARYHAWPTYKEWRETKLARMTQEFMAAGDYDNALLTARQVLRDNQRNLTHWKLAAGAAKAKESPDAIYYQQNVARLDHTLDSRLELIRLALQHGAYREALAAIEAADASATRSPEFHELAARAYLGMGRHVAAKMHLYSLVSLQGENDAARLDLAEIELTEDAEGKKPKLRDDIRELANEPELRTRALTLLLKDALALKDGERAVQLATELQGSADLSGEQRVLVLAGLAQGDEKRAAEHRVRLQEALADDPKGAVALARYFRDAGPRIEARKWFDALPSETRDDPLVQEAIAAAYLEWQEWARLDQVLTSGTWKDREFMRQAFAAYSARKTGRLADAGNAWRLAVIQAGDSPRKISEMLTLVARWGWQTEQYDLVWKLFALMPRNESISRQLIAWERHNGRTSNLNRIYARLTEFAGDDPMIKNNFAYTSMLLDANLSRAYEFARTNYESDPQNPFFATTHALALYKQDKPKEALVVLESLRPAALITPERLMFRALYRAESGDAAGAADLLAGLRAPNFLPEERRLVTKAAEQIARLDREKGEDLRLYALNNSGEIDRTKGWLNGLPASVRDTATVEMAAADTLFAMGDLRGLGAQLRKGAWGEREHLRLALIAYVSRSRSEESSARSYWRTALGSATGSPDKLKHLEALAATWEWPAERAQVATRIFEANPGDVAAFKELMAHYRSLGRTAEMVSLLSAYLSANPRDEDQRCEFAYYSMLSGLNVARAYVAAQDVYRASPDQPRRQLVYAFSLWKQGRPQEAWELIERIKSGDDELVPAGLLRAAVLADMKRGEDAARALETFDEKAALPEEARIALVVEGKLRQDARVSQAAY